MVLLWKVAVVVQIQMGAVRIRSLSYPQVPIRNIIHRKTYSSQSERTAEGLE